MLAPGTVASETEVAVANKTKIGKKYTVWLINFVFVKFLPDLGQQPNLHKTIWSRPDHIKPKCPKAYGDSVQQEIRALEL